MLQNGATTVASLNLNGDYTGKTFAVSPFGTGSTALTVTAGSAAPAIPVAPGAATTQAPLTLPAATNNFASATQANGVLAGASLSDAVTGASQPFPLLQPTLCVNFVICIYGIFPSRS